MKKTIPHLSIFILIMRLLSHRIQSFPTYDYNVCSSVTFTPHGAYHVNLLELLLSLSTNAIDNKNGFFNSSVTHHDSAPVYGLYLCRGDLTVDTCADCVSYAVEDIQMTCPMTKEAVIWYDECSLHYSDSNISGFDQEDPIIPMYNVNNISDPNKLAQFIGTTMAGEMASQAASAGKKFATKEVTFSSLDTLYSLVQCSPHLPFADCVRCIKTGTAYFSPGANGARVLLTSCTVRYETHPFYNFTTSVVVVPVPTPESPPQETPSTPPSGKAPKSHMPSTPWGSTAGLTSTKGKKRSSAKVIVRIAVPPTLVALLLAAAGMSFLLTAKKPGKKPDFATDIEMSSNSFTTAESLQYDLKLLQAATNNFSNGNKLGEGGFGAVYRGKLPNGQEIAVKRLSRSSSQGVSEFKNEVVIVAKLQHRNLVKLLGFCLEGDEKLLVYEFVPNKSLDYFLFDPEKQAELDWTRRYKIIRGISRGLLYLHEDSRLRIIHRDIKPSNILLGADMNPKIADFGLAKILGIDQSRGNTNRVAGTYGYMAPEYAFNGEFSESSDVYSYGVLVLEIISGQKINSFRKSEYPDHLMSYAWKIWKENEPLEMMDPSLRVGADSKGEVIRCIHLALLCVQEDVVARPSMSTVVMTLSYHSITLPQPRNPAFYSRSKAEMSSDAKPLPSSVNFVSISDVGPR